MVTVEDFSRIVSAIYAAATTPDTWLTAMSEARSAFASETAGLIGASAGSRSPQSASLAPDAYQSYRDHYRHIDYVLEAVERGPVGLVHSGGPLVALNPKSEFNVDWMRPNRMDDGLFVRLTGGPSPFCFLVAAAQRDESFDTPDNVALMSALVPHLQQAIRTQRYFENAEHAASDIAAALDSVSHGVIVVDARSTVLHVNQAARAILRDDDGLAIKAGCLAALNSAANYTLLRAVGIAVTGTTGAGASLACSRPSGKRSYVVHVLPYRSESGAAVPRALIAVIDPERTTEPETTMLRRLYGLTPAEAEVAIRVLRGDGLKPISDELAVSLATVKTHLHHVFDKTDTHRQAELVRLLLTVNR